VNDRLDRVVAAVEALGAAYTADVAREAYLSTVTARRILLRAERLGRVTSDLWASDHTRLTRRVWKAVRP